MTSVAVFYLEFHFALDIRARALWLDGVGSLRWAGGAGGIQMMRTWCSPSLRPVAWMKQLLNIWAMVPVSTAAQVSVSCFINRQLNCFGFCRMFGWRGLHLFFLYVLDPDITNGNEEAEPNTPPPQKLLILDARSYAAAVANRAKGGGCECPGTCVLSASVTILYRRQFTGWHVNGIKCNSAWWTVLRKSCPIIKKS